MTTREFLQKQGLARGYDLCEDLSNSYGHATMFGRSEDSLNVVDEKVGALRECVEVLKDLGVSQEGIEELKKLLPSALADRISFLA